MAQIAASIREFGMNDPVAVWHDKDGTPVICLDDLTDSQRRAYTLIHNQLTMNTGWDADILGVELEDFTADFDMDFYGFDLPALDVQDTDSAEELDDIDDKHAIQVNVDDENELETVFNKLVQEGYSCKIITI